MDSEHIIQSSQLQNKDELRHQINQQLLKTNSQHNNSVKIFPNNLRKSVLKKIQDNNLTINKADKGNILTIENKNK